MTRPLPLRRPAALAASVLLALTLTACGGDDGGDSGGDSGSVDAGGAPDDASTDEFCELFNNSEDLETADAAHDFAGQLAEVGTPSDVTDEGRDGFEAIVDFLANVSDDDIERFEAIGEDSGSDPQAALEEVFGDDATNIVTFFTQAGTTCAGADLGGDTPSAEVS